jgi:hypothetical protein
MCSTDALNRNVWMYYDPLGRPIQRNDGDGTTTWEWDTAPMGAGKVALGSLSAVYEIKRKAMESMEAQEHLWEYYSDLARRRKRIE